MLDKDVKRCIILPCSEGWSFRTILKKVHAMFKISDIITGNTISEKVNNVRTLMGFFNVAFAGTENQNKLISRLMDEEEIGKWNNGEWILIHEYNKNTFDTLVSIRIFSRKGKNSEYSAFIGNNFGENVETWVSLGEFVKTTSISNEMISESIKEMCRLGLPL